jgi:hypothetical protein
VIGHKDDVQPTIPRPALFRFQLAHNGASADLDRASLVLASPQKTVVVIAAFGVVALYAKAIPVLLLLPLHVV